MAEDQEDTLQQARSTAPPPQMSQTEKVWLTVRMDPGISSIEVVRRSAAAGVAESSVHTLLGQLEGRTRLTAVGAVTSKNKADKAIRTRTFVALGPSVKPEVQTWLEALPNYEELISRARALHAAAKAQPPVPLLSQSRSSKGSAAPATVAENMLPWQPDPTVEAKLAKLPSVKITWRDFEVENICRKLAREHVLAGHTINHKLLARVSRAPGFGYRTKPLINVPDRERFLLNHKALIELMVAEVQEQWTAAKTAAQAPAPEPEHHEEQEPAIDMPAEIEAARVAAATHSLGLEIEPQPPHQPSPEAWQNAMGTQALGMIVTGLRMFARELLRDVIVEEVAKVQVQARVDLQPLHDQVRAVETRLVRMMESVETTLGIRRLTHPDMSALKLAPPAPTPPKEKRKPVVCVIGGNSGQIESIKKDFDHYLDLRFYSGDRVPNEADPVLVVALTRFINHVPEKMCKKKYGEKYVGIYGAATSAKLMIAQRLGIPVVQHH